MTPEAAQAWKSLDAARRRELTEVCWCGYCTDPGSMAARAAWVRDGYLMLEGTCTRCGNAVTRYVETPVSEGRRGGRGS